MFPIFLHLWGRQTDKKNEKWPTFELISFNIEKIEFSRLGQWEMVIHGHRGEKKEVKV